MTSYKELEVIFENIINYIFFRYRDFEIFDPNKNPRILFRSISKDSLTCYLISISKKFVSKIFLDDIKKEWYVDWCDYNGTALSYSSNYLKESDNLCQNIVDILNKHPYNK